MKELIKLLDENLVYLSHQVYDDHLEIFVCSSRESVLCPFCGHASSRIHSTYHRSFEDLPIQGKKVHMVLHNRKYFCSNSECDHTTFAEPFSFIEPKAKKTNRLIDVIMEVSIEVSSVTASKLLSAEVVTISKTAVCNLLKKKSKKDR
jgi:transposase